MITDINQLDLNKTYSYADYLTWQFQEKLELIKGKIFKMSPAPSTTHQRISRKLTGVMISAFKNHSCELFIAPFDVRLLDKKKSTLDVTIQPVLKKNIVMNNFGFSLKKQLGCEHLFVIN
jgi:hypothetical protein